MRELLANDLAASYGCKRNADVEQEVLSGDFDLYDHKACTDCRAHSRYFYESCEDRCVSKHHSEKEVNVVTLENIFSQFADIPALSHGGCCDKLLYSEDTVMVMDMTCTRPEYLRNHYAEGVLKAGKRAKAYSQVYDSICKLQGCETIKNRMSTFSNRFAVFAFRKKEFALETQNNTVLRNMSSFSKMSDNFKSRANLRTAMGNGFYFITQEYPSVFKW